MAEEARQQVDISDPARPEIHDADGTTKVPIKDPDGSVWKIPVEDLSKAESEGSHVATASEYFGAVHPVAAPIIAGAHGLAHGIAPGLAEEGFVHGLGGIADVFGGPEGMTGDEVRENTRAILNLADEAHPNIYGGAQVAGMVAPMFFGAPPVGAAAELGLAAVGRAALHGAAIGAGYGLGEQLSEDVLQNKELAAENYLTAGLKGGVLGMLMGGASHAILGKLSHTLATTGEHEPGLFLGPHAARAANDVAEREASPMGEWLANQADEQALKGAGARKGDYVRFGNTVQEQKETARRLGRTLTDEGIQTPGATKEVQAARLEERLKAVGEERRKMLDDLDQTSTIRPSVDMIADTYQKKFVEKLLDRPGSGVRLDHEMTHVPGPGTAGGTRLGVTSYEMPMATGRTQLTIERGSEAEPAMKFLEEMRKKAGLDKGVFSSESSFEFMHDMKKVLKERMYPGGQGRPYGTPQPHGFEGYQALYRAINDEIGRTGDMAAAQKGAAFADRFKANGRLYGDLKMLKRALFDRAAAEMANNTVGLRTTIMAGHAVSAMLAGNPLGVVAPIASHIAHLHGNSIAAHLLDKGAAIMGVTRAGQKVADRLAEGSEGFLKSSAKPKPLKLLTTDEIRQIRESVRDPDAVTARAAAALGHMTPHAPQVTQAAMNQTMRVASYMRDNLPKEPMPMGPMFGPQKPRPISDGERIAASQMIEVVQDPTTVIDRLKDGSLDYNHVQALQVRAPETYQQIKSYLQEHATELQANLTVQQQAGLAILFGVPINPADQRETVRALQASFSLGNQAPSQPVAPVNQPGTGPGFKPVNIDTSGSSHATQFDNLERNL